MRLLKCVQFVQLKEGEPVLALGMHITNWSVDMGVPDYGFVPAEVDVEKLPQELKEVKKETEELYDDMKDVLLAFIEHNPDMIKELIQELDEMLDTLGE